MTYVIAQDLSQAVDNAIQHQSQKRARLPEIML